MGVALLLLLGVPALAALAAAVNAAGDRVTDIPPLPDELADPPERSVVIDREGRRLATLEVENRRSVSLQRVPDHVINAVLATEDQSFWEHEGVNWSAIMRAAALNASSGEIAGGGSTITQQLVKNRVVGGEQSLNRKITEAVYASQLERRRGKREILEMYLNDTYFGNGVYGIATAAEYYWRKPVRKLNLAQAALLAGIIRSPERNNPVDEPENALARRTVVLDQMVEQDIITRRQARRAARSKLNLRLSDRAKNSSPFLVDVLRRELERDARLGDSPQKRWNTVLNEGLRIRTTFDLRLQRIAERTIRDLLDEPRTDPLASIVAIDPKTGDMLTAAVGPERYGNGPRRTTVNPAVPGLGGTGRQPGSTFKAFEVVTALEHDVPITHGFESTSTFTSESPQCPSYEVRNYGDADLGYQQMPQATATSSNTYFLHLMDIAGGPSALADTAKRMGIRSNLDPVCSLVLGSKEVYPAEMAGAFATLANDGVRCRPHAVSEIRDRSGKVLRRRNGGCKQVIEEDVAHQATSLLRGPLENGTASANGQIGRPAAGKTGTTTDYYDAWFVGYIPQMSVATWVGHELQEKLVHPLCGEVTGGCLPTMLWQRFMAEAIAELDLPLEDFPPPPPPPAAPVPSVTGMHVDQATATLTDAGFTVARAVVSDRAPVGTVVGQSPAAGEELELGSAVSLAVSDGVGIVEEPPEEEAPDPLQEQQQQGPLNLQPGPGPGPDPDPDLDPDGTTDDSPFKFRPGNGGGRDEP
ncbi:MAG TPA: transglycosylase domain-containing protein [Euzebyales bacterium]